jgi:glycosyltransferase involved in cell wall biosynthesis
MYKIAVITPYYKEPLSMLRQTHESVLSQTMACEHFLVADGHPQHEISSWQAHHVVLPKSHADNGNTPRGIGSFLARIEGYDFIAYLDADNWFEPNHIQSLVSLYEKTKTPVCSTFRNYYALDDTLLPISEQEEDQLRHVDTSCFLIHSSAYELIDVWLKMPKQLGPICDRVFFCQLKARKYSLASTRQRTVNFRSQYEFHYALAQKPIPQNIKSKSEIIPCYDYLKSFIGIKECLEKMNFWPLMYM